MIYREYYNNLTYMRNDKAASRIDRGQPYYNGAFCRWGYDSAFLQWRLLR